LWFIDKDKEFIKIVEKKQDFSVKMKLTLIAH